MYLTRVYIKATVRHKLSMPQELGYGVEHVGQNCVNTVTVAKNLPLRFPLATYMLKASLQ